MFTKGKITGADACSAANGAEAHALPDVAAVKRAPDRRPLGTVDHFG